jgi:hypothetical protein
VSDNLLITRKCFDGLLFCFVLMLALGEPWHSPCQPNEAFSIGSDDSVGGAQGKKKKKKNNSIGGMISFSLYPKPL